jgi:hypothetical protein
MKQAIAIGYSAWGIITMKSINGFCMDILPDCRSPGEGSS